MAARGKTHLAALLLLAVAAVAAAPARAQVAAPRLVEEGDEPADDSADRPPVPAPRPQPPTSASTPGGAGAPADAAAPAPAAATSEAPAAAPPAAPTAPAEPARSIEPVRTSWPRLVALWAERRAALREGDPARAQAAQQALLDTKRELDVENLVAFSAAEVREVHRALASNLPAEALARADVAVALAPDHPDAHLARARALLATAPASPGPVLAAVRDAIAAAGREPHTLRAFEGDLFSAALAAVFTASAAVLLLLLLRNLRLFLHDFHHLPLLRGTASIQTGFLALVLLAMPVVFGLGPFATLAIAAIVAWAYLSVRERLVATAALAALLALPWAAGAAARITAWTGSTAELVHEAEHGALSDEDAAELAARAARDGGPAPLLAALGRHAKRRGDLEGALRLYHAAGAADPRAPELDVNVGNVLFLKGDLEGAKAAYLAAQDRAAGDLVVLGAAHYNLSKLYLRTSEMAKSSLNRERAENEASAFLRAHGSDEDFGANRYLVDVPVPPAKIAALAVDGSPEAVRGWVEARLLGVLPRALWRALWPWGAAAALAALWLLGLAVSRLAPARACERCGGAACRRCDAAAGARCGQCVNVFERKGVVDARDRLRKEAQVRRHARFTRGAARTLALVGAGAGQVWQGATALGALLLLAVLFLGFLVWFWRGIAPPPHPSPYVLFGKLAVAVPTGLALWALAVRDAFRRTRS
ncbi:tetratricopeptide repeat protein [Anaeromyxobacter oryzae]|uniref:tetratricopeptide repeat protein n=1 Tax=Anaeromyxobacter oryzae TaxID=2918170 RepID=UPI0020BFFB2B|nr:hypothetical protein [Anaeromyxobacter oryzae]